MRILALETSMRQASLALAEQHQVIYQREMPPETRTAVWLAAAIAQAMKEVDWTSDAVDLVSLTHGPGSFTGLRIGVTTAKMLGFAWQTRILALDTLVVIAHQADAADRIRVAMDARRDELFAACFLRDRGGQLTTTAATHVVHRHDWISAADSTLVTGPALETLRDELPPDTPLAESRNWFPSAATVARLASGCPEQGLVVTPTELSVQYHRKTYAERD